MLFSARDTFGYRIAATDGDIGRLVDLLFEDVSSAVRYLVIDTSGWLTSHKVLLPPAAFGTLQPETRQIPTALTRHQVEESPPIEGDRSISREQEEALYRHHGWAPYWQPGLAPPLAGTRWGTETARRPRRDQRVEQEMAAAERRLRASDLRSAADVIGYYVRATDGEIGHSEDLLINEDDWTIRYLVINTRNWWPGKNVVIAPEWLSKVDWATRHIVVDLTRDDIRSSPEYDPTTTLDRSYQAAPAPWPAILVDLRIALVVRRLDRPGPPVHFGGTMTSQ